MLERNKVEMRIVTQVEEYYYRCDECNKRILEEKQVVTLEYYKISGNGFNSNRRTKHFCKNCAKRKGML